MSRPLPELSSGRLPRGPMLAMAALAVGVTVVGLQSWPKPARTSFGWQVADVAASLWTLLAVTVIVCLGVAYAVSKQAAGLRADDPVTWAWTALVLVAGGALIWDDLYLAALSSPVPGPIIPVFDWMFTFAPALLAGLLFGRRSRSARRAAALGTGVVTVPMLALGWALLHWSGVSFRAVGATVWDTVFFGVLPLVVAVALVGVPGDPERRTLG